MTFLIQTVNNEIVHDFSFQLIDAIKYNNWYRDKKIYDYILLNNVPNAIDLDMSFDNYIPIGTVEFVHEFIKKYYTFVPKPLNVPEELFKYADREIFNGNEKDIKNGYFIKSNDIIKSETNRLFIHPSSTWFIKGNYQISEKIEILSEWRAFVYYNKLVGLQNYSGDFTIFPNIQRLNNMIKDYKNSPTAYTLDVGIKDNLDTVIIECHEFYSCGLYGFSDNKILPQMFSIAFNEIIKNKE